MSDRNIHRMYKKILNELIKKGFTSVAAISEQANLSRITVKSYLSDSKFNRKSYVEAVLYQVAKDIREDRINQLQKICI